MKTKQTILLLTALLSGAVLLLILVGIHPWAVAQGGGDPADTIAVADAPNDHEDCKALAQQYYAALSKPPGKDSVLSFRYTTDVDLLDHSIASPSISAADVMLNSDRVRLTSDEFTILRDSEELLFVVPMTKTLYLYSTRGRNDQSADVMSFLDKREELFEDCAVVECVEQNNPEGTTLKKITLSPDPEKRRALNMNEFTLWIDTEQETVQRVRLLPYRPRTYRQIAWTFGPHELLPAPEDFLKPIEEGVFTHNKRLKDHYAGYTVEDHRFRTE
ncbi:MAG: hypothetical protein J4G05_09030 [Chlorobi bacterium]|nr:hypothetical protein [Chlorobiota bacterium]